MADYLEPLELRRVAQRLGAAKDKWEQIVGALVTHRELGTGCLAGVEGTSLKKHLLHVDIDFPENRTEKIGYLTLRDDPSFSTIQLRRDNRVLHDIANMLSHVEAQRRLDRKELEHSIFARELKRRQLERLLSGSGAGLAEYTQVLSELLAKWKFRSYEFDTEDGAGIFVVLARLEAGRLANTAGLELLRQRGAHELANIVNQIRFNETKYAESGDPGILATISSMWRSLGRADFALDATDRVFGPDQMPLLVMPSEVEVMLLNTRGAALRELVKWQSARDCAQRSIKILPNHGHAYCMLSKIYRWEGDTKAADANMALCEALSPDTRSYKWFQSDQPPFQQRI
jgi:hypothetical protein